VFVVFLDRVADEFLSAGSKVRGAAKGGSKVLTIKQAFHKKYGEGRLEAVAVPDIAANGAFDESC
jgi:hypothetical protein